MPTPRACWGLLWVACGLACGGATPAESTSPRSPTTDYPPPAVRASDGQVVGADGVAPEDRLRGGPKLGTGGLTPAERPGGPEPHARPPECKDGLTVDGKPCKPPAAK